MKLRDYQENFINALKSKLQAGSKRVVCVLPTGGGKSVIIKHLYDGAINKGKRVMVLSDMLTLHGQLSEMDMEVMMIQTLKRRIKKGAFLEVLKGLDLLIIDECHIRIFDDVLQYLGANCIVLGFTATPVRTGKGLDLGDFYDSMVIGSSVEALIKKGNLVDCDFILPKVVVKLAGVNKRNYEYGEDYNRKQLSDNYSLSGAIGGVVQAVDKYGGCGIVFNPSIEVAEKVNKALRVKGINSVAIHGGVESDKLISDFKGGVYDVACVVQMLTKGFDYPAVDTIYLNTATSSVSLYLQMLGRGSRPLEGKSKFRVVDLGSNYERLGGYKDDRGWVLKKYVEKPKGVVPKKMCPKCGELMNTFIEICLKCDFDFIKNKEVFEAVEFNIEAENYNDLSYEQLRFAVKAGRLKKMDIYKKLYKKGEVHKFIDIFGYNEYAKVGFAYNIAKTKAVESAYFKGGLKSKLLIK